jgi:putative N6-adenine-specific DNA methylase
MKIVMTTLLGVESLTAGELYDLGYARESVQVSDGQIRLDAGDSAGHAEKTALAAARLNINLRTAERVLVELASFQAADFDTLFDTVRGQSWEEWLPPGVAFHVNGYSRKSVLASIPACQSLIKKAIVSRMLERRGMRPTDQLPEDERLGLIKIQFSLVNDQISLMVDTSGDSLHKRGYRPLRHESPIRETLAAAMLLASRYQPGAGEAVYDPFCGSGTLPIEAALIERQIAPGLKRSFAGESWPVIGAQPFRLAREEAAERIIRLPSQPAVFGSDIAAEAVALSRDNASRAGVESAILFRQMDVGKIQLAELSAWTGYSRHLVICNPPYGERSLDIKQAEDLYNVLGRVFLDHGQARPGIRLSVIAAHDGFENLAGGMADKRRKLYNGMIKCTMYHYFKQRRPS